ncbi:MAG: hypothetical protein EDM82_04785 [Cyanobacteria bacterium CYA]|nr:MAG: hypothetical protein EDM82_04785 [Cyanobacteria bacterium CYA]
MRLYVYADNDDTFQNASPWLLLHTPTGAAQYTPAWDILNDAIGQWVELVIPYNGDSFWSRTDTGTPDLHNVSGIEIHADTWGDQFSLYLDGLSFGVPLFLPSNLRALAGNGQVTLLWDEYEDLSGSLAGFNVYRDTDSFDSVEGMTPVGTVLDPEATSFVDTTAENGVSYFYAVTAVSTGGGEALEVSAIGPHTPFDELDLQVVCVSRTPRFPRYDPLYTYYTITEPGGYGPYSFSAATGLGSGQTGSTQRWPNVGQTVTYTATVRNRGSEHFSGTVHGTWTVDGVPVSSVPQDLDLNPRQTATYTLTTTWDGLDHDIQFQIDAVDDRPDNNDFSLTSLSVAFLSYADLSYVESFREQSASYPDAITNDFFDWLNAHMERFNELFAAAGCDKRVHFDVLAELDDGSADPTDPARINFAIFPFRYYAGDGSLRLSGYYDSSEDLDYGLLHEMGHQLGLIDIYRINVSSGQNQVSGQPYAAASDLMNGVSHFLSEHSAGAMNHWLHTAHGYYGQFLYQMPDQVKMRFVGYDGTPLAGAQVRVYQKAERPGLGEVITNQVKFSGVTDANGEWLVPNVDINPAYAPTTYAGDTLRDNPFGYVAVIGTNSLLLFEVEHQGRSDYAWLDVTEVNNAYWGGQTGTATFERSLSLGGGTQYFPPLELTEGNAASWDAWAADGVLTLSDDPFAQVGDFSLKYHATGGFDNSALYPADRIASWDLGAVQNIHLRAYAVNPNFGFQDGSPWVILRSLEGYIELRSTNDAMNQAIGQWREFVIPLAGSSEWARTVHGTIDPGQVQSIELHVDTWGAGFTVWFDGLRFDPPVCPGDYNADGLIDIFDVLGFLNDWSSNAGRADITEDGVLDVFDVLRFLNLFSSECS